MKPKIRKHSAFTLIELLVVIAIIVILASLVVGNVARAKMAAHRVTCMSHLKQWAMAAQLYAQDNEDVLPREAAVDGINSWETTAASTNRDVWYNAVAGVRTMVHYAQTPSSQQEFYSNGGIFHCPRARFSDVAATYPNFSLAMNSKLMRDFERQPGVDPDVSAPAALRFGGVCRLTDIKDPVRTVLFADNGVAGEEKLCAAQEIYTGQPKASAAQFPGRHNGGGNIAFAEGHVETVRGADVVEMEPGPHYGKAIHPPRKIVWCPDPALVP
ncbi:MAG: prepilin-type N-terminal cleavage/methylation domain-containing protein [Verrucomicrobia subdivision 3 bacterium]|nr:prepilin-type N-terminal cleavage/methylation domain-containing protein [Limisphaerales bacterium]